MADRLTAAILNWNGGDMVLQCLRSLQRQERPPDQLIVVDNGSSDGSLQRLVDEEPRLQVIRNERNLGFARAANQAVAASKGQWLMLANLDIDLEPDYISRLLAAAARDPSVGSITGKLLRPKTDSSTIIDSTGHIVYRNGWAANRGEGEPDHGQWEEAGEV